jgi:hypothetical protein
VFDLPERAVEQVGRPPSSAVAQRVAQVHHQRVEIVGQAPGGGGEPLLVELVDERLQSAFGVLFVDRLIQRLPVGVFDAFAFAVSPSAVCSFRGRNPLRSPLSSLRSSC